MPWEFFFWLLCLCINVALVAIDFYQLIVLTDLEADHINLYEASSHINGLILYEFILQGVFSALFLVTRSWLMFLLTAPLSCYNVMLLKKQQHLIDITEAFRNLKQELRRRWFKLFYYLVIFFIVIFRTSTAGKIRFFSSGSEELDIRASFLEF